MGFARLESDHSVYRLDKGDDQAVIAVYVDDQIIAANSRGLADRIKSDLATRFKLRDLGELSYFLGVKITRDRGRRTILLNQDKYVKSILERFGMRESAAAPTPMSTTAHDLHLALEHGTVLGLRRRTSRPSALWATWRR